ncbi:MAG TPA: aromatic ring-hydroxylating dioxygenase subunit alpha [Burkholderiaceae bacterium]|nr:aromatic ring-hydroxylating dioxygenase subunit alpha [Burkholderiaceae bacterium]
MIEATHWHPVALSRELAGAPVGAVLLGDALVLWRDADGVPHAWSDRCPHRGASLSMGRLVEAPGAAGGRRLECPYHGWRFGADAHCEEVPAQPGFVPPPGHRARAFEALDRHGMVWVRLAPGALEPPPFPAEDDARLRKVDVGPYDVATSAPRVVENFLDMAHFGFVHEGSLGDREHPAIEAYRVEDTPLGMLATACRAWQPASSIHATGGAVVEYTYEVVGPYTAVLTKVPQGGVAVDGFREAIALFACPTGPETCRVWFRMAMTDFESSDDAMRAFQHAIFAEDAPIVTSQRPKRLPLDPAAELHGAADRSSAAYRRALRRLGITYGTC